jgi:hypothetical protein
MIFTGILKILYNAISFLIQPITNLSDASLSGSIGTSITTAGTYLKPFETFLPIGTMLIIFGIFLVFEFSYGVYKVIMWVIKKIPTIN